MKISREDVLKVAALANLELSDAEVDSYRGHLDTEGMADVKIGE